MEGSQETDFIHGQVREAVTLSIAGLLELAGWCMRLSHWRTPPLCAPTPVPAWWHLTPPSSPLLPSDASLAGIRGLQNQPKEPSLLTNSQSSLFGLLVSWT